MSAKNDGKDALPEVAGKRARRQSWWTLIAVAACRYVYPGCACNRCGCARQDRVIPGS